MKKDRCRRQMSHRKAQTEAFRGNTKDPCLCAAHPGHGSFRSGCRGYNGAAFFDILDELTLLHGP